jgi:hypothetical protein
MALSNKEELPFRWETESTVVDLRVSIRQYLRHLHSRGMPAAGSHTDPLTYGNTERAHAAFVRRSVLTAASDDMDNLSG